MQETWNQCKRSNEKIKRTRIEIIKGYFETGKNVSDEIVNLDKNKVKVKKNTNKVESKVRINYFANRLIRKS